MGQPSGRTAFSRDRTGHAHQTDFPPKLEGARSDDHERYLIRSTTVARSGEARWADGRVTAARAARERLWGRVLLALVRPHHAGTSQSREDAGQARDHPELGEDEGQAHGCPGTPEEPALGCAVQAHGCPGTPEEPAFGCAVGRERTRASATQAHRWT
jgi:hypothetical protein